ncbi:MAG: ABC transporter permease, partial [Bacteroidia bacterium]|nr:ABC transporter permease [Bacteroidia bacterium]
GNGVKEMLAKNFEGFATNTTIIAPDRTSKPYKGMKEGRWWSMELKDVERLKTMVPELDVVTPLVSVWGGSAVNGALTADCTVKGVAPQYSSIETPRIKFGRYINSVDIEQQRKVCVIGKRVYQDLFPDGGDPCGTFIQVGPCYYQVVGVDFNTGSVGINGNAADAVSIPLTLAQALYHRGNTIDLLCMTGKPGVKMSELEDRIRSVVAREHMVDPTDEQGIFLLNTEELFSIVDNLFIGLDILIWLIGLGTLLAGAIGVSNIMMVTVKERTVEIGIRRAIGATPKDILGQVMAESVVLTLVAGMLSIMFTVLVLAAFEMGSGGDAVFQISFCTAVVAALLLTALGVAAGLAPASRAMAIKPVDAMRDE